MRPLGRRCAAEATGTALLVAIGTGAIVAGANAGGIPQWALAVAWFVAVTAPVLAFARLSGAHLNPAVTLSLVAVRRFPPREGLAYIGAQLSGALVGSAGVWALFGDGAHLGATLPRGGNVAVALPLEFAFTLALAISVLYITAPGKVASRGELLLPGTVVGISTFLIGPWTGSSLNPARSLAPALLTGTYQYLWAYLLATVLGGLAASALIRWGAATRPAAPAGPRPATPP